MTANHEMPAPGLEAVPRVSGLRLLSFVFFLSGAVSLVYQVVWQRLLTLYYGVGPVSTTLIVSVYMLGLGIGALVGGFVASRIRKRLVFFMLIQFALGSFGMGSPYLLISIGRMTASFDYTAAFFCMFGLLCIPTVLMGMTLPLLVQIFSCQIRDFQRNVAFLYFINTLGAAAGAIVASFILISFIGLDGAAHVAAVVNFILAALIGIAARARGGGNEMSVRSATAFSTNESLGRVAFVAVFATGFLALAYEIIWFRVVGVLIKDTSYAFSSILAVYLVGVALGSKAMDHFLRGRPNVSRRSMFFMVQALIGLYVAGSVSFFPFLVKTTPIGRMVQMSFSMDHHPTLPWLSDALSENIPKLWSCLDIFLWPAFFCLVPTFLMGATFPLLAVLTGSFEGREGRIVGNLYFWNIVGNVAGALSAGFVLLPVLGSERTIVALSCVGLFFLLGVRRIGHASFPILPRCIVASAACAVAICLGPARGDLYKAIHVPPGAEFESYLEEGVEGVVMVYVQGEKVRMHIGGTGHGGRPGYGFIHQAIETLSFAANPRRLLVIGFGTGSIVETALETPGVESVTLVELNGTVMRNLSRLPVFAGLLQDSRLRTFIEDGRRYLLQNDDPFDAILMDPLYTKTAYSGNLYSQEFFALAQKHLRSEGVLMAWFDENEVFIKTLASVFPRVRKYRHFAIASAGRIGPRNEERRTAILSSFSPEIRRSIEAISEAGTDLTLSQTSPTWPVNTDLKPVTEYYLGPEIRYRVLEKASRIFRRAGAP